MLISGDKFKYTLVLNNLSKNLITLKYTCIYIYFFYRPAELQYYTSLASIIIQIPASLVLVDIKFAMYNTSLYLLLLYILNGIFFHFQSITAYVLMDYISPVTYR